MSSTGSAATSKPAVGGLKIGRASMSEVSGGLGAAGGDPVVASGMLGESMARFLCHFGGPTRLDILEVSASYPNILDFFDGFP
jgi:hypothetical protein